jgi:hypothetical protein
MPVRKTKRTAAADTGADVHASDLAAAADAAVTAVVESAEAADDATRVEDESTVAATYSALSEAAAQRGSRDAAQGAATFSMADEVAAGGEIAAALSSDEFRRGMELAGIAGQVQVAAELLGTSGQPTLAAFLGHASHQLRGLAVGAIGRATEGAVVAHGAQHLAGRLATLGLTEMDEGRDEYASSVALGAASAEMAAEAVQSAAAGAVELAAAAAMGGLAEALATEGADDPADTSGADQGAPGTAAAATPRVPEPATRASSKRTPRKPARPKK